MSNLQLTNDEKIFWADLVIYVEQEVKPKRTGFYIKDKGLKSFLRQNSIKLKWDRLSKLSFDKEPAEDTIIFSTSKNIGADLLCHLRNAFAHLYIEKDCNGDYILSDYYNRVLKMKGHIKPQLLFNLIDTIKATHSNKKGSQKIEPQN